MIELIKVDESHTDFILSLNNDLQFSKSFPRKGDITRKQHLNFLKHLDKKGDLYYVIRYNDKDVGVVSIYDIDNTNKKAEWGRFIVLPEHGSVAFPVSKLIIKKAFKELKLHKLYAHILTTNPKVVKFNKLLGFKEEGVLKDHYKINGEFVDVHYLALLNNKGNDDE
ncbi:GNAT family N-acetyltransferase [bacterium]|nr:GNAT family N-acetyltransferase [bacterium]